MEHLDTLDIAVSPDTVVFQDIVAIVVFPVFLELQDQVVFLAILDIAVSAHLGIVVFLDIVEHLDTVELLDTVVLQAQRDHIKLVL